MTPPTKIPRNTNPCWPMLNSYRSPKTSGNDSNQMYKIPYRSAQYRSTKKTIGSEKVNVKARPSTERVSQPHLSGIDLRLAPELWITRSVSHSCCPSVQDVACTRLRH